MFGYSLLSKEFIEKGFFSLFIIQTCYDANIFRLLLCINVIRVGNYSFTEHDLSE